MQVFSLRAATVAATLCLTLAASAGGFATAAEAETNTVPASMRNLDLTTVAGIDAARQRIFVAARRACDQPESPDARIMLDYDRCRQEAIADAMTVLQARVAAAHTKAQFATR